MQTLATERHARAQPPGPKALPFIGSAVGLVRDPLGFLLRASREHGDSVAFRIPGQTIYLFNHPSAIEQILVTERDRLIKDKLTRETSLVLGMGLLVSEGAFWRKQRKLAQPAFHRQRIEAYADVMVRYTERAIASWQTGEAIDVHQQMMGLTLDIVARTLFGVDIGDVARRIDWALEVLTDRFAGVGTFVPIGLPTPGNYRAKKAIAMLDDVVYRIIRERRQSGDQGDLLSMLISATSDDDGGAGMTDKQLRDESITLLLAGHETTALTLSFAFHLLGSHPEVVRRMEREIEEVLGDRPATTADLPKLKVAESIVRESMRLYPPAWAIGREAIEPCRIGGYDIPVGTQLWAAQWVVHRDSRWFTDPEAFKPERWNDDFAKSLPKHAYFPFGGGPRICIGNTFTMMEAVLVLVTIARRFRLSLSNPKPLELIPSVTLRPKGGIPMIVSRA